MRVWMLIEDGSPSGVYSSFENAKAAFPTIEWSLFDGHGDGWEFWVSDEGDWSISNWEVE